MEYFCILQYIETLSENHYFYTALLRIIFAEIYEHRSLLVQQTVEAINSKQEFGGNEKGGNTTTTIISSEHINHTHNSSPTPNRQPTDHVNDKHESNIDEIIVDVQKEIKGKFHYSCIITKV